MLCAKCGMKVEEGTDFCPNCGSPMNAGNTNAVNKAPKQNNKLPMIIGIVVAVIVFVVVVCLFMFGGQVKGETKTISGVKVYVPDSYQKSTSSLGYTEAYVSEDGKIVLGLLTMSAYGAELDDYADAYKSQLENTNYSCGDYNQKTFNDNNWMKMKCEYSAGADLNAYFTIKDNKVYVLNIVNENGSDTNINSLLKEIEKNLDFAA